LVTSNIRGIAMGGHQASFHKQHGDYKESHVSFSRRCVNV